MSLVRALAFMPLLGKIKVKLYMTSGSSSYIEAVVSLLGINNDQLIQNVAELKVFSSCSSSLTCGGQGSIFTFVISSLNILAAHIFTQKAWESHN